MALVINEEEDESLGSLMGLAQQGNRAAYEELLRRMTTYISRFLSPKINDAQGLEEVVQETLISIHEYRHTFDPRRSLASWAFAIAQHRMIDHFRKDQRRQTSEISEESLATLALSVDGMIPRSDRQAARQRLAELLGSLPAKQREVVELLKLDGLSIREAATRLGMTESAIKVTAHRAYQKLTSVAKGMKHEDQ